jgi:ASC-1-like (ASCH) protein
MNLYLKKDPFDSILSGDKTLEVRKFKGNTIDIVNDINILFINKNRNIKVKVISITHYSDFDNMIKNIDISLVRKNITRNCYKNILKKCYKNLIGSWVSIKFL